MTLLDDENETKPIEQLVGSTLNARWKIVELIQKESFQTGSCFSVGYVVEDTDGTRAFAKILDFSRALQDADTAKALDEMLSTYLFERSLLELCGKHGLTRVVRGLDYGDFARPDVPLGKLFFIIFEIAEGDVRRYMSSNSKAYLSWRLKVLHDVAIGLEQLHNKKILHQDLKPSNVLVFEKGDRSKLGDLGRAHFSGLSAPHDNNRRPGAFYYAPPEQIYDHHFDDRLVYRFAGDLYLLGSMLDFFVTGKPTTVRLIEGLEDVHRPFAVQQNGWRGFFRDIIPHLQSVHCSLVRSFSDQAKALVGETRDSTEIVSELTALYSYSTNPDPMLRGHPTARAFLHGSDYDLRRFVSGFEILSKKIELAEKLSKCKALPPT
jgi:serine/threonine protein kinase